MEDFLEDIIKGCKKGKRDAQAKLFKLYARKMLGVSMLYTKELSAAEDVVQDGFIKIFACIEQFNNTGSFEGWMRRIMVNTAIERYRREHFLYTVTENQENNEDISYDAVADKISTDDLMRIIQDLSPQYRTVFSLYAIEGYSHKEISEMLNISESASKSNLSRARSILKQKVDRHYFHIIKQEKAIG